MNDFDELTIITTDHVEPDLEWEAQQYSNAGYVFRHYQLWNADAGCLLEKISDADILIVDKANIDAAVIGGLGKCRLIIRHGDGYDNIDIQAAAQAGIVCINQPGYFSRSVAEQTLAMALAMAIRLPLQQKMAATPPALAGWDYSNMMPIRGCSKLSVGIIGFGRIGQRTATLFNPIVDKVYTTDHNLEKHKADIDKLDVLAVSLDELLFRSHIVCLHVPANSETIGMFDQNLFDRMREGAVLVNTARGSLVVTDDLVRALKSGKLAGVALDCNNPEPLPPDHELFRMNNVIITPHFSWYNQEALWNIRKAIVSDVLAAAEGICPQNVLNPQVFEQDNCRFDKNPL